MTDNSVPVPQEKSSGAVPSKAQSSDTSLSGRLLIATPAMQDPRFEKAVILMCNHDEDQAFGLVLNQPLNKLTLAELFTQLEIMGAESMDDDIILVGGPVETQRGFVIHSSEYFETGASIEVRPNITVTPTKGILTAMASDAPPQRSRLALGYAGWDAGQLDEELLQNAWLVADPSEEIIYAREFEDVWTQALATIGVKPEMLSMTAGHA